MNSVFLQNKKFLIQNFPQDSLGPTLKQISPTLALAYKVMSVCERDTTPSPWGAPFVFPMPTDANGYLGVFHKIFSSENQPPKKG